MIDKNFYRAFEDAHRGPRDVIKKRLHIYTPFIKPFLDFNHPPRAVDLGCGRGEWLELLTESGFDAIGVDLDEGMLRGCNELGLKTLHQDAIAYLKSLPDNSQAVISAFHMIEHIPFEDIKTLVEHALRVLQPGGILILETPNPENIVVGSSNFYVDPTHNKPIPPLLLAFIPEYYGYARVKVLRLQASEALMHHKLQLLSVLNGVSPDYAVIAQKDANPEILTASASVFGEDYGYNLDTLATQYDQQIEARIEQAESNANLAKIKADEAEFKAGQAEMRVEQEKSRIITLEKENLLLEIKNIQLQKSLIEHRLEYVVQKNELKHMTLQEKITVLEKEVNDFHEKKHHISLLSDAAILEKTQAYQNIQHQLNDVYESHSWKITYPLRLFSKCVQKLQRKVKTVLTQIIALSRNVTSAPVQLNEAPNTIEDSSSEQTSLSTDFSMSLIEPMLETEKHEIITNQDGAKTEEIDWQNYPRSVKHAYQQLFHTQKQDK